MSLDGAFEQDAVLLRAKQLCGGRVYDSVPDEADLPLGTAGLVRPYIVLGFGEPYEDVGGDDRSLMGEEEQPMVLPIRIDCWGPTRQAVRATAGAIRDLFIGWIASPGSSEIRSDGRGSSSSDRSAGGVPTRYTEQVPLACTFNLGSNDGFVPTPDGGGSVTVATIQSIADQAVRDYLIAHPPQAPTIVVTGPTTDPSDGEETTVGTIGAGGTASGSGGSGNQTSTTTSTSGSNEVWEQHDFPNSAGQWTVVHALGRIPSVETYTADGMLAFTDVHADANQVVVTWAQPTAGFVILR